MRTIIGIANPLMPIPRSARQKWTPDGKKRNEYAGLLSHFRRVKIMGQSKWIGVRLIALNIFPKVL